MTLSAEEPASSPTTMSTFSAPVSEGSGAGEGDESSAPKKPAPRKRAARKRTTAPKKKDSTEEG